MMLVTFAAWIYLYMRRTSFLVAGRVDLRTVDTPAKADVNVPHDVNLPAYALKNLFELPVLFYAAVLLSLLLMIQDPLLVQLAWGFVIMRVLHSVIHCTYNDVNHRFAAYALSTLFLLFMWIRLAAFILTG